LPELNKIMEANKLMEFDQNYKLLTEIQNRESIFSKMVGFTLLRSIFLVLFWAM